MCFAAVILQCSCVFQDLDYPSPYQSSSTSHSGPAFVSSFASWPSASAPLILPPSQPLPPPPYPVYQPQQPLPAISLPGYSSSSAPRIDWSKATPADLAYAAAGSQAPQPASGFVCSFKFSETLPVLDGDLFDWDHGAASATSGSNQLTPSTSSSAATPSFPSSSSSTYPGPSSASFGSSLVLPGTSTGTFSSWSHGGRPSSSLSTPTPMASSSSTSTAGPSRYAHQPGPAIQPHLPALARTATFVNPSHGSHLPATATAADDSNEGKTVKRMKLSHSDSQSSRGPSKPPGPVKFS